MVKNSPATQKKTVLVAEDDFYMRSLVKAALGDVLNVVEVESGDQVLAAYKEHKPVIVLLDIHLPKKSGNEVLQDLLAHDPEAYVTILSADSALDNVKFMHGKGAKGFITKPFTRDTLVKYVFCCPALQLQNDMGAASAGA